MLWRTIFLGRTGMLSKNNQEVPCVDGWAEYVSLPVSSCGAWAGANRRIQCFISTILFVVSEPTALPVSAQETPGLWLRSWWSRVEIRYGDWYHRKHDE